jgi:hypothetical protein
MADAVYSSPFGSPLEQEIRKHRASIIANENHEDEDPAFLCFDDETRDRRQSSMSMSRSLETTASHRKAQMELYDYAQRRLSGRMIVDLRGQRGPLIEDEGEALDLNESKSQSLSRYGSMEDVEEISLLSERLEPSVKIDQKPCTGWLVTAIGQVPAIAVVSLFWLMMAFPFGVASFHIGLASD